MRRHKLLMSLIAVGTLAGAVACGSDGGGGGTTVATGPTRGEVVAQITDDVILPGLAESTATATTMKDAVTSLCATPTDEALTTARDAWRQARKAWMATSAYRVGPIGELRSKAKIAYPINADKLEALLASGNVDLDQIDNLGAHLRGLGGVEYVLFTPDDVAGLEPARCAYAQAASMSVVAGATELEKAWSDGYAKKFKDSAQDAINQLVNGSLAALASVADMTLGQPVDQIQGASHNAIADGVAELGSVEAVWGRSPERLAGLVEARSQSAADAFHKPLAAAADALGSMKSLDDSDQKSGAAKSVNDARVALRTQVASQLGVTVTFTDSDGDG